MYARVWSCMCMYVGRCDPHISDKSVHAFYATRRIVEAGFGGISPHSMSYLWRLSERAKAGADRTEYGTSRTSTTSFFIHHSQRIALASITGDAWQIRRSITERKMRLNAANNMTGVTRKRNRKSAQSTVRTPGGNVSAGVA